MNTVNQTSTPSTLASALQQIASQTQPADLDSAGSAETSDHVDTLNLSGSSLAELEQQAEQIASQNQSSALTGVEDAFAANLQAVGALASSSTSAATGQGAPDSATALTFLGNS